MMSDPTPVPLDEIKQRRTSYSTRGGVTIAGFTPEERDALCEALRIAVEGLDVFAAADTDWVHGYADEVLAAVRELVDPKARSHD